jgi:hypothetical protein
MKEAVKHIDTAFRHLTLASDKIDKAQTNGTADDVPVLREFRVKQNAIRAIRRPYLTPLAAGISDELLEKSLYPVDSAIQPSYNWPVYCLFVIV